jgi:membrane protease subunit HflK
MASRLMEEANGYLTEVVQRSEGDASRFRQVLVEYQKAPNVTRDRLYLDMMQSVLGTMPKVVIDQKSGSGNLLYLPLDKLQQQALAGAAAAPESSPAPPSPRPAAADPPASVEPRARDGLRSRER